MKARSIFTRSISLFISLLAISDAITIPEINGVRFQSAYSGQSVENVTGLVTAKGNNGFWVRSTSPDDDARSSESIYVFGSAEAGRRTVGEIVSFNGRVTEYRSSSAYLFLTEITSASSVRVLSSNNEVAPLVLGGNNSMDIVGRQFLAPPTDEYSSLDDGDVFGVPNNRSQLTNDNPTLEPSRYGLDFWESLTGELVTIRAPIAVSRPTNFNDTWVIGDWAVTGRNSRGGLTSVGSDANPEAIIVGDALDGSNNPSGTKLGDSLEDITGVITQQFGFYYILPQTALRIRASRSPELPPPTSLVSRKNCSGLTFAQYNIENFSPSSPSVAGIAEHIVTYLRSPSILFLQEVQDNNGRTNDNVVDANVTLSTLRDAIVKAGGPLYNFTNIDPIDDTNGGEPGGNIRNAYLYDSEQVQLYGVNPGNATAATAVRQGAAYGSGVELSFNPGLIEPTNSAFRNSRKPLVAQWSTPDGSSKWFTINQHLTSKGGSSSLQGSPRPPVNQGVNTRQQQLNITSTFIQSILKLDSNAAIITAGDFNEFAAVSPVILFANSSKQVNINEAAKVAEVERYTYLFGANSQELDQMFISRKIADREPEVDHVHVNTWVSNTDQISDHDPSVARLNVCQ